MRTLVAMLGLVMALACSRGANQATTDASAASSNAPIVAHVDGEAITADELGSGIGRAPGLDAHRALDAAIARKLAAREAKRRELDRSSEVAEKLAAVRRDMALREEAVLRDALFASLSADAALSDAELRASYEKTKVRYTERRLHLRRAAFPSAEAAADADAKLGADGRLDPASSEEIGPAPIAKLPQTVLPEILRLRAPGQRVVVARPDGVALVELIEILPAETLPFEDVRDQVEATLRRQQGQQAFRAEIDKLRAAAKVEIDEAALRAATTQQPPAR